MQLIRHFQRSFKENTKGGQNKMGKITKIHRKYPDSNWDFKALSLRMRDNGKAKDLVLYKLKNNGKKSQGVEIFSGSNYIVGSSDRSSSRRYAIKDVPSKYKDDVKKLMEKHRKTKWSNKKYLNLN